MSKMRNIYNDKGFQKFMDEQDPYPFDATQIEVNSRVAVCGSTKTGKTTALFHYLEMSPNTFSKVIVFYKESEPIYEYMNALTRGRIEFHDNINALPTIAKMRDGLEKNERVLLIVDDWIDHLKDPKVRKSLYDVFLRGRKKNVSVWLLCQSYYMIPLEFRQNLTYLMLFKMPTKRDTDMILDSFTSDVSKEELREIYRDCTKKKFDFLKIEVANCPLNKKFARNFDEFIDVTGDEADDA